MKIQEGVFSVLGRSGQDPQEREAHSWVAIERIGDEIAFQDWKQNQSKSTWACQSPTGGMRRRQGWKSPGV